MKSEMNLSDEQLLALAEDDLLMPHVSSDALITRPDKFLSILASKIAGGDRMAELYKRLEQWLRKKIEDLQPRQDEILVEILSESEDLYNAVSHFNFAFVEHMISVLPGGKAKYSTGSRTKNRKSQITTHKSNTRFPYRTQRAH